ncbi:MAG: hypothetical protein R3B48_06005 [Kofleriaceae bacterium]
MGAGSSREAGFDLVADLPAGPWKLIGDGVILEAVDMTFEVVVRRGATELPVASWQHHFEPRGGGSFDAVPFEESAAGTAVSFRSGDRLIFRYTGASASSPNAYVPNGDGARQNGRIPNLTLPR